jgi:hypothetical protein
MRKSTFSSFSFLPFDCYLFSPLFSLLSLSIPHCRMQDHPFILRKDEISGLLLKEATKGRQWFSVDAHAPVLLAWSMWVVAEAKQHGGILISPSRGSYSVKTALLRN